MAPKPYETEQN